MTIEDFLDEFGIPFRRPGEHKHARGGWIQLDCPKCGFQSGKYHLGLSISRRLMNCWKCGPAPVAETLAILARKPIGFVISRLKNLPKSRADRVQYHGTYQTPPRIENLGAAHRRYLENRGFDPDAIASIWGVKGIGLTAELKWRLWIPILDVYGKPVSWTTRSLAPNHVLRYISAKPAQELISHKRLLYGEQFVKHTIIVHEGPADVWRTGPGAVATLGLGTTPAQMAKLAKYPTRWICFDNEPEAQRRAATVADALSVFPGQTGIIRLESAKDAAEADPAEVAEIRKLLI